MNTPDTTDQTLSINGKDHSISSLPSDIQNLLVIFSKWETELKTAKIEVFKLEAAIKGLSAEIELRVKQFTETPEVP